MESRKPPLRIPGAQQKGWGEDPHWIFFVMLWSEDLNSKAACPSPWICYRRTPHCAWDSARSSELTCKNYYPHFLPKLQASISPQNRKQDCLHQWCLHHWLHQWWLWIVEGNLRVRWQWQKRCYNFMEPMCQAFCYLGLKEHETQLTALSRCKRFKRKKWGEQIDNHKNRRNTALAVGT